MRRLIPFSFTELGPAEWALLLLALGGLFALGRPRWPAVVAASAVAALLALLRLIEFEGGSWDRWGPLLVAPPFAALVLLAGHARAPLERLLGGRRLAAAWLLAVAAVALARPFGLGLAAWPPLALPWLGLASLARREWPGLRLGPVRAWQAFGILLLGLSAAGGWWPLALLFLAFLALAHAVLEQGQEMRKYVRRRLIGAPLVLMILLMASFVLIRAAPGGPFDKEKKVAPEVRVLLERKYGLDDPLPHQFGKYMRDLVWFGDLGESTKHKGQTANDVIARHAGPSLRLGLAATALALLVGLTSGLVAGIRRNSIFDYASMTGAMVGLALPTFVVGPLLVLLFSMKLRWFNVAGWDDLPRDLVLPAIALSLPFAARVARLTRAGMLEVVHQDYVRTARAKGLSEPMIVVRHTLKGALLPVVTFLGPAIAQLLTGSLVVETIFGVPGLGVEFVQSAVNRDYSLAMGLVVFFGGLLIAFNLAVDIAYGFLDPRIRHA